MSLKEQTVDIFKHYGLSETEIDTYMVFLSYPQFTVSEVAGVMDKEEDLAQLQEIAVKLEKIGFIKKIPGVVDRYVPCEPYFELFTTESAKFRSEINTTKDETLSDQSSRFENLESIETQALEAIKTTVEAQIGDIFRETDTNDVNKKELLEHASARFHETTEAVITKIQTDTFQARDDFAAERTAFTDHVKTKTESAEERFTTTSQKLQTVLQNTLFELRDRFTKTSQDLEQELQTRLDQGRDRYTTTSKDLENHLHSHIDADKEDFHTEVGKHLADTTTLWDSHAAKFQADNANLNSTLTEFSDEYQTKSHAYETEVHTKVDELNKSLKGISEQFKVSYHTGIQEQKNQINQIMGDLLQDFSERVENLERECKKSLDDYVAYHKENASGLKPNLDEILEKNILRMKEVIDALKHDFTGLLEEHTGDFIKLSEGYRDSLKNRVETRHSQLAGQVSEFKKKTEALMDNLSDTSDRYTELAGMLASRGSAWKALLFGTHKKFQANYQEIQERISNVSGEMKENFNKSTAMYIQETNKTSTDLKREIEDLTSNITQDMQKHSQSLDKKQQDSLDASLDGIANELSAESDATIQRNVKEVEDTNIKLKDAIESSFKTHHEDYDLYLNKHLQAVLDFDDTRNRTTKETVNAWYKDLDAEQTRAKTDVTGLVNAHLADVKDHLTKTTTKNTTHSGTFERDVLDTKIKQKEIFDACLQRVDSDFDACKKKISADIDGQVQLIHSEVGEMNQYQRSVLDEQIRLVKADLEARNQEQLEALKNEIALFKQEVQEINATQQEKVDQHIQRFREIIQQLDTNQSTKLKNQIALFSEECTTLESQLHEMFEKYKSSYDQNTHNLQTSLTKTIETNIQDTKDAIADFTLTFMNSIDELNDNAENNEASLNDINLAARNIQPLGSSSTWHVFGIKALLQAMVAALSRVKSTITIITPKVEPKILEALSQVAYSKKSSRFLYTTNWDMNTYARIVEKMKQLGNIQFRNLKSTNDFYAVSRDGEEIILCPQAPNKDDMISIISMQDGYVQIFGSFIYPMFQANSRPI